MSDFWQCFLVLWKFGPAIQVCTAVHREREIGRGRQGLDSVKHLYDSIYLSDGLANFVPIFYMNSQHREGKGENLFGEMGKAIAHLDP